MNTELLLKVKAHILEEPRRLWMSTLYAPSTSELFSGFEDGESCFYSSRRFLERDAQPPCGTVGCICGWGTSLSDDPRISGGFPSIFEGEQAFGISPDSAHLLFFVNCWPEPFQSQYGKCSTPTDRARVTADRIDHFIATEGRE